MVLLSCFTSHSTTTTTTTTIFDLVQPIPEHRQGEHSPAESSVSEDHMRKETDLSVELMNIVAKMLNKVLAN